VARFEPVDEHDPSAAAGQLPRGGRTHHPRSDNDDIKEGLARPRPRKRRQGRGHGCLPVGKDERDGGSARSATLSGDEATQVDMAAARQRRAHVPAHRVLPSVLA
jgi:hypothetical protein